MIEMTINDTDALSLGVHMGDGFISEIDNLLTPKEYITNESRLRHGVSVLYNDRVAKREVNLPFVILGTNEADFRAKRNAFEEILLAGEVVIGVPTLGKKYTLTYMASTPTYKLNRKRNCAMISVKFLEANPMEERVAISTKTLNVENDNVINLDL